MLKDFSRPVKA